MYTMTAGPDTEHYNIIIYQTQITKTTKNVVRDTVR